MGTAVPRWARGNLTGLGRAERAPAFARALGLTPEPVPPPQPEMGQLRSPVSPGETSARLATPKEEPASYLLPNTPPLKSPLFCRRDGESEHPTTSPARSRSVKAQQGEMPPQIIPPPQQTPCSEGEMKGASDNR